MGWNAIQIKPPGEHAPVTETTNSQGAEAYSAPPEGVYVAMLVFLQFRDILGAAA